MGLPSVPDAPYSIQQALKEIDRQLLSLNRLVQRPTGSDVATKEDIDSISRELSSIRHASYLDSHGGTVSGPLDVHGQVREPIIGVRAYNTQSQSVAATVPTLLSFDRTEYDVYSMLQSNSRLVVPVGMGVGPGVPHTLSVWQLVVRIRWEGVASPDGYRGIYVLKNASSTYGAGAIVATVLHSAVAIASTVTDQECVGTVTLTDSDYLEVFAVHSQSGGGGCAVVPLAGLNGVAPSFAMFRLGFI